MGTGTLEPPSGGSNHTRGTVLAAASPNAKDNVCHEFTPGLSALSHRRCGTARSNASANRMTCAARVGPTASRVSPTARSLGTNAMLGS
jgi:hypothetical protein